MRERRSLFVVPRDNTEATVAPSTSDGPELPVADGPARRVLADQLVEEARATGVSLVGPGGLLADITKRVLETGLEVEIEPLLPTHRGRIRCDAIDSGHRIGPARGL